MLAQAFLVQQTLLGLKHKVLDGLMTGIQRITNFPIAAVRAGIEITVVSIGWYLGGTVGVGTLLFAFGIGPAVALGLYFVGKFFN